LTKRVDYIVAQRTLLGGKVDVLSSEVKKLVRDPEVREKIRQVLDAELPEEKAVTVELQLDDQAVQEVKIEQVSST
jgi:hypothetical protein